MTTAKLRAPLSWYSSRACSLAYAKIGLIMDNLFSRLVSDQAVARF